MAASCLCIAIFLHEHCGVKQSSIVKFLGLTLAWCLLNMGTLKGLKSICTYVQTPVLCSLVSSSKPNGTCGKSQMLTTYNSAYINVSD